MMTCDGIPEVCRRKHDSGMLGGGRGSNGDDFAESRGLLRASVIQNRLCADPASTIRHLRHLRSGIYGISSVCHDPSANRAESQEREKRSENRTTPMARATPRNCDFFFFGGGGVRISRHPNHGWRNRGYREVPSPPGPIHFISWVEHRWTQYITKMDLFLLLLDCFSATAIVV